MAAGKTSVLHTASTLILAANRDRKGIWLSPHASNNVWVNIDAAAVSGEGLLLKAGTAAVYIGDSTYAKKALYGYAETGSSNIPYLEIF